MLTTMHIQYFKIIIIINNIDGKIVLNKGTLCYGVDISFLKFTFLLKNNIIESKYNGSHIVHQ
jgi:hypothetical protein